MTGKKKLVEDDMEADESLLGPFREKLKALPPVDYDAEEITALAGSDADMARFLIARNNNLEKAFAMAKGTLAWRSRFHPAALTVQDFATAHGQDVWRFAGTTKNGWNVLHVTAAHWKSFSYGVDEYVKMVSYHVERSTTKNFIIFDMYRMAYFIDMRKLRALAYILADYYPERLGCAVFVNCDWIFDKFFNIAIRWVDQRTANKCIDFRDNGAEFLLQHIDADQVTTKYGGTRQEPWPLEPLETATDDK
ncbi:CRAL TRIO domain protein [Seminavis robusta]|uniref:CRAL TRIO domain protein n=1 Tax=Seminavis robusta TaxID=568900 RepID=A0A9N8ED72_9STRA|nr:CRAL TRIO domain protein [Seminavis robusta]|eukprot:Sro978_g227130.1 CRAL TRIO domain protein (250) ;mRNA; f:19915-20664